MARRHLLSLLLSKFAQNHQDENGADALREPLLVATRAMQQVKIGVVIAKLKRGPEPSQKDIDGRRPRRSTCVTRTRTTSTSPRRFFVVDERGSQRDLDCSAS